MSRPTLFSLAAGVTYTLSYYFDWPLFQYYPAIHAFHLTAQPASAGFPILWYGWMATAVLVGVFVAFAVPKRWAGRLPPDIFWMLLIVLLVAVLVYEKRWFFV
jgi:hypothetical protein